MNVQQPEIGRSIDDKPHATSSVGTHESQDWTIVIPENHHALITHHFSGANRKHVYVEINGDPNNEDNRHHNSCEDGRRICTVINNYDPQDMRATFTPGFFAQTCAHPKAGTPTPGIVSQSATAQVDFIVFYYFEAIDPVNPDLPDKIGIVIVVQEGILITECP